MFVCLRASSRELNKYRSLLLFTNSISTSTTYTKILLYKQSKKQKILSQNMVQFQLIKISLLILVTFLSNCNEIPCVLTGLLESLIFSADIVFRCTMKLDYYPFSDISCRFLFSCSSSIYIIHILQCRMGRFFVSKFTMVRVIRLTNIVLNFLWFSI